MTISAPLLSHPAKASPHIAASDIVAAAVTMKFFPWLDRMDAIVSTLYDLAKSTVR